MSKTTFEAAIPSRPTYGELEPRPGSSHLFVADGEGAAAVIALFDKAQTAPDARSAMLARSQVLYVPGANGTDMSDALRALGAAQFHKSPSFSACLSRLTKVLTDAHMGLQIYAAGTEGLMAQVAAAAQQAGFVYEEVQTEHRGSLARRVQCVHCKGVTEHVTLDPFVCSHCGLNLFVRDHFSRRLAAFQGVNIDAEDPGLVPQSVERFK
jgi:hypothetical protein